MSKIEVFNLAGLTPDERATVGQLAAADPDAARAYADAVRPEYAVIVAGYPWDDETAQRRPRGAPHWSGVVFWPWVKGEVITVKQDADEQGRRPHKWRVGVQWFGLDRKAAEARAREVHAAVAEAVLDDTPGAERYGRVSMPAMVRCAWCGITAHPASMEQINRNRNSVACRDVKECQVRIDQAE